MARRSNDFYETAPDGETCDIYLLSDPTTGEFRYVGRAKNAQKRYSVHLSRAKVGTRQNHCATWIRSLLRRGLAPTLTVVETVELDRWAERERFWIKALVQFGCDLTNANDGGHGPWVVSEETRKKLSAAGRGNKGRSGQPYSPEERHKLSRIHKARLSALTPEQRKDRVSAAILKRKPGWNRGWHHTPTSKARIGAANSRRSRG